MKERNSFSDSLDLVRPLQFHTATKSILLSVQVFHWFTINEQRIIGGRHMSGVRSLWPASAWVQVGVIWQARLEETVCEYIDLTPQVPCVFV